MRLVAGDGEVGLLAFGAAPVGVIAIGVAPFGIVALGPLATGVFAASVGGGWVRGMVGGVCGVGLATCWRSYIVGAGVAVGGRNLVVGAGISVDAIEQDGMALSWCWKATAPSRANIREWRAWRRRIRDEASELLSGKRDTGIVVADAMGEELSSSGVAIEATPEQVGKVRSAQRAGKQVDIEVQVEESMSQDGYRASTHQRTLRLLRQLSPVSLRLGSIGFWLMLALVAGISLFTRASFEGDSISGLELGPSWDPDEIIAVAPAVERDRTMRGTLAEGDPTLSSGEFTNVYTVDLAAGESIDVELSSAVFDTYLIVRAPDGTQEENDDVDEDDTDSSVEYTAPETGTYRVIVTSYESGQGGSYQLVLRHQDRPISVPKGVEVPLEPVRGTLSRGDGQMRSGEFRDFVNRTFAPGQLVEARLESDDFDAYLIVMPPSGGQTDNDDLAGTNAGIDILSAEEGTYRFTVTSYAEGETGDYVLRFRSWEMASEEAGE